MYNSPKVIDENTVIKGAMIEYTIPVIAKQVMFGYKEPHCNLLVFK